MRKPATTGTSVQKIRSQSEVLSLERRHIDLKEGTLRLEPGTTKNDDGRVVYPHDRVEGADQRPVRPRQGGGKGNGPDYPVPVRSPPRAASGECIRDFRKAWATACKKAGVAGRLRHDFRRTAVRNMVNRGIAERVAMKVTGHKTRAVFDRYHIVSPGDLQDVAKKLSGTFSGTSQSRSVDAVSAST